MPAAKLTHDLLNNSYSCQGSWSIQSVESLFTQFKATATPSKQTVAIHGHDLTYFDSAGALVLSQCIAWLKTQQCTVKLIDFNNHQLDLLALIEKNQEILHYQTLAPIKHSWIYVLGKHTMDKLHQFTGFVGLLGDLSQKLFLAVRNWRRFRIASIISIINSAGLTALPIVGLLSFLIGVVLAYQMGLQLETYGASVFIAYLSGMAIFREFGPLITAIIVAGRTSSAFTAQIGSMTINEEIDALLTMGLSPTTLLVVPKVLGLLLIFPFLIYWSDVFSIIGAMIMSHWMLHVGYLDFLDRLQDSVGFKQFMLGIYKAPAFALITALVGCFQGFRVKANADSVGSQTTKSVVQALFLIIVADATYSIIYSWLDL